MSSYEPPYQIKNKMLYYVSSISEKIGQIDTILDEIKVQSRLADESQSEYVKRLRSVMEYDVPYTAKSILELLDLRSKETLRKNYLNPAIEQGLVVMTLPDKPQSRNQRYVKK